MAEYQIIIASTAGNRYYKMNRFDNIDCMIGMKEYPDKYFDLAIVDPPYGINIGTEIDRSGFKAGSSKNSLTKFESSMKEKSWDNNIPFDEYFIELKRVSINQIIWGGNYFANKLTNSRAWICWDKLTFPPTMSRIELAYTSFDMHSQFIVINSNQPDRQHPTQKPIKLYKWLLTKYAKPNDKILDTHVGSASSLIACEDLGFEYVGFELDEDYYKAANKRLEQFRAQLKLAI